MNIRFLQTFKTILEMGSFKAAAEKLNMTQSTVTSQIQQLNYDFSLQLFEKIGRRMVVTQAGKDILPYINEILHSYEQMRHRNRTGGGLQGSLTVAMPETLLTYKMQPVLQTFRERAPDVALSLQTLNCHTIRDFTHAGNVDIGIHYNVGGYASSLMIDTLAQFPVSVVRASNLPPDYCDLQSMGHHNHSCLITNDHQSIYHKMLLKHLNDRNISLRGNMELGSVEAIKRSVSSGLGIAILPRFVTEDELLKGDLKEIECDLTSQSITAISIYHKNKWVSPAMALFMSLTQSHFNR